MEYAGKLHFALRYDKEIEGLVVKVSFHNFPNGYLFVCRVPEKNTTRLGTRLRSNRREYTIPLRQRVRMRLNSARRRVSLRERFQDFSRIAIIFEESRFRGHKILSAILDSITGWFSLSNARNAKSTWGAQRRRWILPTQTMTDIRVPVSSVCSELYRSRFMIYSIACGCIDEAAAACLKAPLTPLGKDFSRDENARDDSFASNCCVHFLVNSDFCAKQLYLGMSLSIRSYAYTVFSLKRFKLSAKRDAIITQFACLLLRTNILPDSSETSRLTLENQI